MYASAAWKICSDPSALIPTSCRILVWWRGVRECVRASVRALVREDRVSFLLCACMYVPLRLHRDARLRSGQTAKTAHRCQALAPGSGARGSLSTRATNTMSPQTRREICVGCSCASAHHTYGRYLIRCVYICFETALPNGSSLNQSITQSLFGAFELARVMATMASLMPLRSITSPSGKPSRSVKRSAPLVAATSIPCLSTDSISAESTSICE